MQPHEANYPERIKARDARRATEKEAGLGNQEKGRLAAERLKQYVDKALEGEVIVPMFRGFPSKQQICEIPEVDVTYSTIGSNDAVKTQFERLAANAKNLKAESSPEATIESASKSKEKALSDAQKRIKVLEGQLAAARKELKQRDMEEEHLLKTGRVLHRYHSPKDTGSQQIDFGSEGSE